MLAFQLTDISEVMIWVTASLLLSSFLIPMVLNARKIRGAEFLREGMARQDLRRSLLRAPLQPAEITMFLASVETLSDWGQDHAGALQGLLNGEHLQWQDAEAWEVWEQLDLDAPEFVTLWHKLCLARELSEQGGLEAALSRARARCAQVPEDADARAWLESLPAYPQANLLRFDAQRQALVDGLSRLAKVAVR